MTGDPLTLDMENSRYLQFYESLGFRNVGEIRMGDLCEYVLYRSVSASPGEDVPSVN